MKIKLLTIMAGPKGIFQPGSIIEMSEEEGKYLIESRQAEAYVEPEKVETEAKTADAPPAGTERADLNPLENAGSVNAAKDSESKSDK